MSTETNREGKRAARKRPKVTIYFESEEQLAEVERRAQGNLSGYCRDRILFDEGYYDPHTSAASRLLFLAGKLDAELHRTGDVVRALTCLRQAIAQHPVIGGDASVQVLVDQVGDAISIWLGQHEARVDLVGELTDAMRRYASIEAAREASLRAATVQRWERTKP